MKQQGDNEGGLRNQEAAVRVAPDQPQAWNNLANTYMDLGRFDDATRSLEAALKLQDAAGARINLFVIGVLTGNTALAEAQVNGMRGKREEVDFLRVRVTAAMYRGRFAEAATIHQEWLARMDAASRRAQTGQGIASLAVDEAFGGLDEAARQRVAAALDDERFTGAQLAERLVLAAQTRDAAAAGALLPEALAEQRKTAGTAGALELALRALALIAEGRGADAAELLEPLTIESANREVILVWTLARVTAGQWEQALKGLAFLATDRSQRSFGATKGYALATLGRAYAELGRTDEARKTYQAFFELWKDADPDVPLLVKAREEFAKLGS